MYDQALVNTYKRLISTIQLSLEDLGNDMDRIAAFPEKPGKASVKLPG